MTAEWREMVAEESGGKLVLPEKAFVFEQPNGESCKFFDTAPGSSNPPVFGYYEMHLHFDEVSDSFWEYVESNLRFSEEARRLRPQSPIWSVYEDKAWERAQQMRKRIGVTDSLRSDCRNDSG